MMRRYFLYGAFIGITLLLLFTCKQKSVSQNPYRNIENAQYVGMEKCRSCHEPIYQSFIQTGMGKSWDYATKSKSAADFSEHVKPVFDSSNGLYYRAYWKNDSLYIAEYKIENKDTIHYREEKITYIVGSGQHTNSHLILRNGYLYQAPITFYTQKGKWDLAPGFEHGNNTRFSRKIEMECISCHNGYPAPEEKSLNKYNAVKTGIDCERCHGAGSLHVEEKLKGEIIDTSKNPDYSIVNPRRLSSDLQNAICQRCHLQGIAVLQDEKDFFSFKPSQLLHQSMDVFMPSYSGQNDKMIMASQVERLQMSKCFINSHKLSCITCHNPHVSVKQTSAVVFNAACNSCHNNNKIVCSEDLILRQKENNNNCNACHMAKNSSIDIPHVAVTDHYIRKNPKNEIDTNKLRKFIGMQCINNPKVANKNKAKAYLEFFERYENNPFLLDSANDYLSKTIQEDNVALFIRLLFLQEKYDQLIRLAEKNKGKNFDAWSNYRIGASYLKNKIYPQAISYLEKSVSLKPFALDFQYKLGAAYLENNQAEKAQTVFLKILHEDKHYEDAYTDLSYISLQKSEWQKAIYYASYAVKLNPLKEQNAINLAVAYYQKGAKKDAEKTLRTARKFFPKNEKIQMMLSDLTKHF